MVRSFSTASASASKSIAHWRSCLKLLLAELGWREEAVAFDQPGRVVGFAERQQRLTQFLDGRKGPHPQQVFLERPDEPFDAAVALGRADEGGRTFDAEEPNLLLEVVRHIL